ncbi:hypothetical protein [Enhygromyxa salina]|uniref:Uncharacterized protein n=1 Tax=Enhygromyxa salina TaxID=215803 RepID=A0A2S9YXP2_9BACT|nr:hypothetical protein [Enhygromyxa salina]PRQ09866.1 hypothetical protein ENSA7_04170 [Enhygromyxa salina]
MTIAEELHQKGLKIGLEKGREEGRHEARVGVLGRILTADTIDAVFAD